MQIKLYRTVQLTHILKSYGKKLSQIRHFRNGSLLFEEWGINLLPNKLKNLFIPKGFLLRLTLVNIVVIVAFVMISSWAIYNTACLLADGIFSMTALKHQQFRETLF